MFKKLSTVAVQRMDSKDVAGAQGVGARLLNVCEGVLQENAPRLLTDEGKREWLELLAAVVLDGLEHSPPELLKDRATPRLMGEIACRVDITLANADDDYERVRGIAKDFTSAIAPRRLVNLLSYDKQDFKLRLGAFIERRNWDEQTVRQHAENIIEPFFHDNSDGLMKRFNEKIPTERLRTYHDPLLRLVGRNFADWDPLLEFLEDRSKFSDQQEQEYQKRKKSLENSLSRGQPDAVMGVGAEDAIQDAVVVVLETRDNPRRGYTYESNFFAWLTLTSRNILKNTQDKSQREESLDAYEFD